MVTNRCKLERGHRRLQTPPRRGPRCSHLQRLLPAPFPPELGKPAQRGPPSEMLKPPPGRSEPPIAMQDPKQNKQVLLLLRGGERLCKPKMQTTKLLRGKRAGSPSTGPGKEGGPLYHTECRGPDTRHLSPLKVTGGWQALGNVSSWLLRQQ